MNIKKVSVCLIEAAAILAVSITFYNFLGQAAAERDPKNIIFYFTVFYGIVPIVIGITMRIFTPSWEQMLISAFVSLFAFALVAGASRFSHGEAGFTESFAVMLLPFAFMLPAVFATYALLKAASRKQPEKQHRLTLAGGICGAALYIMCVAFFIFMFCDWVLFADRHFGCYFIPLF